MGEIQVIENRPLTKDEIVAQKRRIQEVMQAVMKEGTHYGVIPGCKKPSLFKPGSEAILSTFHIAPDPIAEDLSVPDLCRYRVKVVGYLPSGAVAGYGIGECSSDEEKYRWRRAVCQAEFDATPEDRRRLKYYKDGGTEKQVRTNVADVSNTILKMAKKRAQIDLTLTATGASDVFDQDLEDLPEEIRDGLVNENKPKSGKPEVKQPQSKSQVKLTESQEKYFPRIEAALVAIFGEDQAARDAKMVELTTWTKNKDKDNEEVVHGTADYRIIKTDKTLEILCHKLEKLAEKAQPKEPTLPEMCNECGGMDGNHESACPSVVG